MTLLRRNGARDMAISSRLVTGISNTLSGGCLVRSVKLIYMIKKKVGEPIGGC